MQSYSVTNPWPLIAMVLILLLWLLPESGRLAAVPALIDGTNLSLKLLAKPIRQAHWLPAK